MLSDQSTLIQSLLRTFQEREQVPPSLFETHISWVLVTEHFAYKIKKAVQFEFLDFSTLDLRHFYCQEELRLNARLSPELYLAVVAIVGTPDAPAIDAPGLAIEYAVKMRAFSQQAIWGARLQSGCLLPSEVDALARKLAQFHQHAAVAAPESIWGSLETLVSCATDNLASITELLTGPQEKEWSDAMGRWQKARQDELADVFQRRKAMGRIRECHGDLHCGNIVTINDQVGVFDCIEFKESLRWIDVMDDIAFACMDLSFQRRADLASRLLNQYLEISGDYDGLAVFRYYQLERLLVRCKVALLRAQQVRAQAQSAAPHMALAKRYMEFSQECIHATPLVLVLMHGCSGSGKSCIAECLADAFGAIRIRSDVERKRIYGQPMVADQGAAPVAELYDAEATHATYGRLRALARQVIQSGLSVIVDAACLRQEQRQQFATLARELAIPHFILDVRTGEASMRERVRARALGGRDPSDADLAILTQQIASREELCADELKHVISVDGERRWTVETVRDIAAPLAAALGKPPVCPDQSC